MKGPRHLLLKNNLAHWGTEGEGVYTIMTAATYFLYSKSLICAVLPERFSRANSVGLGYKSPA